MNKRYGHVTLALMFVVALLLNIGLAVNVSPVYAQEILPREEIIWGAGYWPGLGNFNPVRMDEGMGWDTYIAYEPVFGTDVASGKVFGWLAEKPPVWDTSGTTLTIKLRNCSYWVKIADWDGWLAGTYTPEYYRNITAEDVVFSWYLAGACPESPSQAGYMQGIKQRVDTNYNTTIGNITMSGFEIVDDKTIKLHIAEDYAFSDIVYRVLTRSYLVVPYDIWLPILNEYWDFTNDWTDPNYPLLRVASGMYLPWKHIKAATDRYQTIIKRNDNWWGQNPVCGFGKLPAPKYMGYYVGYPNDEIEAMLKNGEIDWDGSYVPGAPWATNWQFLRTYYYNKPYFPDKSALLMVPNYRKWPICEPWLHWAIAYVINYTLASEASSGYCVDGSKYPMYGTEIQYPNAFLIPKDDAIANNYLKNYPRRDNYLIGDKFHTVDEAIALLAANCWYVLPDGTYTDNVATIKANMPAGDWYTKGSDTNAIKAWIQNMYNYLQTHGECGWFNNDPDVVIGVEKHKASVWLENWDTYIDAADQLPAVPGINVMLGYSDYPNVGDPWTIIDIEGWTDVNLIDYAVAERINNVLDIPFEVRLLSWDAYTTWVSGEMQTYVYDFADYCMHWGMNGNLYERYAQLFTCWSGCWNHYNGWYNETLINLINQLDNKTLNLQDIANQIFDIIGQELPYIPLSGHPDWYIYSRKYWLGWPDERFPFLPASPYGGASQDANLHVILLNIVARTPANLADINRDGITDMKDLSPAGKAFMATPGHPRWDPRADVDDNCVVNMKDLSLIGKQFKKPSDFTNSLWKPGSIIYNRIYPP